MESRGSRSVVARWARWRRRRRQRRFLTRVMTRLDGAGKIQGPAELHGALLNATQLELNRSGARKLEELEDLAGEAARAAVGPAVELLTDSVLEGSDELIRSDREHREGFERRLGERWGSALELADLLRLTAVEAAASFHERNKPAAGDWVYDAIVRLHARACLISSEIAALLRSGHASGAHARWRALHEVVVVAFFIAKHGQETARRYRLHDAVASYRALADYQRFAPELNYDPFDAKEVQEIKDRRDELCKEFGDLYGKEYGWAAEVFGFAPSFRRIEDDVDLAKWRPYYRWASQSIHADPKALVLDLGVLEPNTMMLAGPSNAGLADPGHSMCISLGQITTVLLGLRPELGDIVIMQFLLGLVDAAGEAFITGHRKLDDDASAPDATPS